MRWVSLWVVELREARTELEAQAWVQANIPSIWVRLFEGTRFGGILMENWREISRTLVCGPLRRAYVKGGGYSAIPY